MLVLQNLTVFMCVPVSKFCKLFSKTTDNTMDEVKGPSVGR